MKTKLLHIITRLDLGGAQKNVLSIIKNLPQEKYEIFLISAKDGLLVEDALDISHAQIRLLSFLRREINPLYDIIAFFKLYCYIKKNKIQIVHTHSSKAGVLGRWAAWLAWTPFIIHTIHGWEFHEFQNRLINWLFILLERITAFITDRLIAVCNSDIQKGLKNKIGGKEKYVLIPYGIDAEELFRATLNKDGKRGEFGIAEDVPLVGLIACFKPQKAILDFIHAASLVVDALPNTRFLLVGDGILKRKIEKLIGKLGLKQSFLLLGWRRDVPQIMPILDVLVLSSLWEGLPVTFLEAMAQARPVVATSVGGIPEIIKDGINGFLVAPKDTQSMAQRIIFLLRNRDLARNMGRESNRMLARVFQTNYMIGQIDNLYANALMEQVRQ